MIHLAFDDGFIMQNNQETDEYLRRISEILTLMSVNLVNDLNLQIFSGYSKIVIKILLLREVLTQRIFEIAQEAFNLFKENKIVPAIILTRSIVETSACIEYLYDSIDLSLKNNSTDKLEATLKKLFWGSKNNTKILKEVVAPINIIEIIRKVDKKYDGFLFSYEELSEFCHPNWSGCIGSYTEFLKDDPNVKIGLSDAVMGYPKATGLSSLEAAMELCLSANKKIGEVLGKFVLHSKKY
jgi:hypothetical protein